MKHELRIFLTAVLFYTRLPVAGWVGHQPNYLNQATRYLPVIGWLVGLISAVTFLGATYLFSPSLGILFSMIASILVTGAFHEDGFADVCDGFGGGWTKERILEIMKDSRLGTYGVVGLILIMAAKFFSLQQLAGLSQEQPLVLVLIFIAGHSLSRYTAATFIFTHPYVRLSEDSKVKPVAQATGKYNFFLATVLAFIPLMALILLANKPLLPAILLPLYLLRWYLGRYFNKWLGGYTGDCLGATQQVCEVFIYLAIILLWKFT
jgi:adenosylcobinamide-GDP ribazoletransferase